LEINIKLVQQALKRKNLLNQILKQLQDEILRRYRTNPIVWFTKFIWNANGFAHQRALSGHKLAENNFYMTPTDLPIFDTTKYNLAGAQTSDIRVFNLSAYFGFRFL